MRNVVKDTFLKWKIEILFPYLKEDDQWKITSPATYEYNCVAWTVDRNDLNIWPMEYGVNYTEHRTINVWFNELPLDETLVTFVHYFNKYGYRICDNDWSLKEGYEKIALYSNDGINMSHVTRQCPNGMWKSKLGNLNDIIHSSPHSLEDSNYGIVCYTMERQIKSNS